MLRNIVKFTAPGSIGTASFAHGLALGEGETPDAMLVLHADVTSEAPTAGGALQMAITDGVVAMAVGGYFVDDVSTTQAGNNMSSDENVNRLIYWEDSAESGITLEADFDSWDDTDVTLQWDSTVSGKIFYAVMIKFGSGGNADVHEFAHSNEPTTVSTTKPGFEPDVNLCLMSSGAGNASGGGNMALGIGFADGTNEYGLAYGGWDGRGSGNHARGSQSDLTHMVRTAWNGFGNGMWSLDTFDATGYTLDVLATSPADAKVLSMKYGTGDAGGTLKFDLAGTAGNHDVLTSGCDPKLVIMASLGDQHTSGREDNIENGYFIGISDGTNHIYISVAIENAAYPTNASGDSDDDAALKILTAGGSSPTVEAAITSITMGSGKFTYNLGTAPSGSPTVFALYLGDEAASTSDGETTEGASARIALPGEVTEPATARVALQGETTEAGTARIQLPGESLKDASARVAGQSEVMEDASARVAGASETTEPASARVASRGEITGPASARIESSAELGEVTEPASARISQHSEVTEPASARAALPSEVTEPASARVSRPSEVTEAGTARVAGHGEATEPGTARIAAPGEVVTPAAARVSIAARVTSPGSARIVGRGQTTTSASANVGQVQGEVSVSASAFIAVGSGPGLQLTGSLDTRLDNHDRTTEVARDRGTS